jgi:hypothetical protein
LMHLWKKRVSLHLIWLELSNTLLK